MYSFAFQSTSILTFSQRSYSFPLLIVKVGNGAGSITTLPYLDQSWSVTSCDSETHDHNDFIMIHIIIEEYQCLLCHYTIISML